MRHFEVAWAAVLLCSAVACSDGDAASDASGSGASGVSAGTGASSGTAASAGGGSGEGGTSVGGAGTGAASSGGAGSGGAPPSCTLQASGPIVVSADNQVIENLHIVSTDGPAITIDGFSGVVIRDCLIEHAGGPGIELVGATDARVERTRVTHTGAPAEGENPSDELINIVGYDSAGLTVDRVALTRGSSGIYLVESPNATLTFIEGHDFRGPFPRGQLVQLDKSDGGVLEDFSVINPQASSWPEDNVNVYQSNDVQIRRGLVDGNNSPSGVGVIFDGDQALGVVEDVDAVRMGNGCFSDYAGSDGVVFRRTRCRDNICGDQGRGLPLSNALMWCGREGYTQIVLEDSKYFASCNGNLVWPDESFAVLELDEEDFQLRAPIVVDFCWE